MPTVEQLRADQERQGTGHGFVIDLSSPAQFDPQAFDREIRIVNRPWSFETASPREMSYVKFIVVGDRMLLFSADENHVDGLDWMRRIFPELDLSGDVQSAG